MNPQDIIRVELINQGFGLTDFLSVATVIGAWIAVFISQKNIKYIQSNLNIVQQQENRMQPKINIKVVRSSKYYSRSDNHVIYAFCVRISNMSDLSNAIKSSNMKIDFKSMNIDSQFSIPVYKGDIKLDIGEVLIFPMPITARETIENWLVFRVDESIISDIIPVKYTVEIVDTFDNVISDEVIILKEVNLIEELA